MQLCRPEFADVPTGRPRSIRRRVGEIIFHSSLVAEMQAITAIARLPSETPIRRTCLQFCMHRIGPPRDELHERGRPRSASRAWLAIASKVRDGLPPGASWKHTARDIGVRETLDVAKRLFPTNISPRCACAVKDGLADAGQGLLSTNA